VSISLGISAYANRRKFVLRLRGCPQIDYNEIVQAEIINGFVGDCPLGLISFHGCGYAAVDEGHGIISAVRIRTYTQTEYL